MAGPALGDSVTRDAQIDVTGIAARAVTDALPRAREVLPQVGDNDLRRLLEIAQRGNQTAFSAAIAQVAPTANARIVFNSLSVVVARLTSVETHVENLLVARIRGDSQGQNQAWDGLQSDRRAAEREGQGVTGTMIMGVTNTRLEERGRENNWTPEQMRQAREDAATAALGHGFSLGDVLSTFGTSGNEEAAATNQGISPQFAMMMQNAATASSERMRGNMRELQDRINSTTDVSKKRALEEDYQQLLSEYSRLVGGAMGNMADRFARGEETAQTNDGRRTITVREDQMVEMARAQADLHIRQHSGRLGEYVPIRARHA